MKEKIENKFEEELNALLEKYKGKVSTDENYSVVILSSNTKGKVDADGDLISNISGQSAIVGDGNNVVNLIATVMEENETVKQMFSNAVRRVVMKDKHEMFKSMLDNDEDGED